MPFTSQNQTVQNQYVQVGDIKTRYWQLGNQGSPVLCIHGIGSAIETWSLNLEALAERHRVYAFDLMGSGYSDPPQGSYSLAGFAQFVKAFADVLNLAHPEGETPAQRLTLIGNSLGGGIALQFALMYPHQVEKLVLVNSLGFGQDVSWGLRLANLPWVERLYQPTRISTALTLKLAVFDGSQITDAWTETFYEILKRPGVLEATIAQIRALIDWSGVRPEIYQTLLDRLPTLKTPTLILWGKQDPILPVAQAETAMQRLPNGRLQIFDRCGHWSHFEQAAAFNRLVVQFLAEEHSDGA